MSYKIQKLVEAMTDPMSYTLDGVNPAPPSAEVLRLQKLQRTFHIQFACATSFFVAMLLYVPVGLAIVQDAQHLSIDEVRPVWLTAFALPQADKCTNAWSLVHCRSPVPRTRPRRRVLHAHDEAQ